VSQNTEFSEDGNDPYWREPAATPRRLTARSGHPIRWRLAIAASIFSKASGKRSRCCRSWSACLAAKPSTSYQGSKTGNHAWPEPRHSAIAWYRIVSAVWNSGL